MPGCSACRCNNRSGCGNLSYFRFPIDNPQLCRQWTRNCGRVVQAKPLIKWTPTKHSVLCSAHFEESCFEVDFYKSLMAGYPSKRRRPLRLKPGSVPTLFEHSETKAKPARQLSLNRSEKASQAEVSNFCH